MVIRGKTLVWGGVLAVVLVLVLVLSSNSSGDDSGAGDVQNSLGAIRKAEDNYFAKHSRYTDRLPELQLVGGAGVSGTLTSPVDRDIQTSDSGRMVTVIVHTLDGDHVGWFSLMGGSEYGVGGLATPASG